MFDIFLCGVKVNKNFAIKLVAEEPVTDVGARVVSCDGGGGALGHPKVYINLVSAYPAHTNMITWFDTVHSKPKQFLFIGPAVSWWLCTVRSPADNALANA